MTFQKNNGKRFVWNGSACVSSVTWTWAPAARFGPCWKFGWRSCWTLWALQNRGVPRLCSLCRVWPSSSTWRVAASPPSGKVVASSPPWRCRVLMKWLCFWWAVRVLSCGCPPKPSAESWKAAVWCWKEPLESRIVSRLPFVPLLGFLTSCCTWCVSKHAREACNVWSWKATFWSKLSPGCPVLLPQWVEKGRMSCSGMCVLCCLCPGCARTSLPSPLRVRDSPPGCLLWPRSSTAFFVSVFICREVSGWINLVYFKQKHKGKGNKNT